MPSFRRQAPRSKESAFASCLALTAPPSEASASASVSSNVGGGRGEEVEGARFFIHNVSEEETAADDLKKAFTEHGTITDTYNPVNKGHEWNKCLWTRH